MVEQYTVQDGETVSDYNRRVGLSVERQNKLDRLIRRPVEPDW